MYVTRHSDVTFVSLPSSLWVDPGSRDSVGSEESSGTHVADYRQPRVRNSQVSTLNMLFELHVHVHVTKGGQCFVKSEYYLETL